MAGREGTTTRNVEPTVRDIQGRMVGERERGRERHREYNQAPRTRRQ